MHHFWFQCKGCRWAGDGIPGGGEKAEDSLEVEEVLCRKADTAQPTSSRHRALSISHQSPMFFQTETTKSRLILHEGSRHGWEQKTPQSQHRRGRLKGSMAAAGTRRAPGSHSTAALAGPGSVSRCPAHASFSSERGSPLQQAQRGLLRAL